RFVYDFDRYKKSWDAQQQSNTDVRLEPVAVASIVRETHYREEHGTPSKLQNSFEYSDGLGRVAMKKVQAEPGLAKKLNDSNVVVDVDTHDKLRWVGNGRTVMNNKGKLVK